MSEKWISSKAKIIISLGALFGFGDAFLVYTFSSYFSEVIESDNVGGFYIGSFLVVFWMLWMFQKIIRRVGGSIRTFFLLILTAVALGATLFLLPVGWLGSVCVALLLIVSSAAWVMLDILLESETPDRQTGEIRGTYISFINAGFLLAPFLSARIVDTYGFKGIFLGYLIVSLLVFFFALAFLRSIQITPSETPKITRRDFRGIYLVSFALEFFYAIMIIYSPIYLRSIGVSWEDIGLLFTGMLLPFVFLPYIVGKLADRALGEQTLLSIGVFLLIASSVWISFIGSNDVLTWMIVLLISRVGAAIVEVMRDSYFFRRVDGNDVVDISRFRTARPIANIAGALFAIPFLSLFPVQAIFSVTGIVVAISTYSIFSLGNKK